MVNTIENICIVGCGNIGGAYLELLVGSSSFDLYNILCLEKNRNKVPNHDRVTLVDNSAFKSEISAINTAFLLAIKPQELMEFATQSVSVLKQAPLVISVMAGIPVDILRKELSLHDNVVRAMPNICMKVRRGVTVAYIPTRLDDELFKLSLDILSLGSKVILVDEENLLDVATAITASGPGIIFYIMEAIVECAVELGFSQAQAYELVGEMVGGAGELWTKWEGDRRELFDLVASKNGTTHSARKVLDTRGAKETIMLSFRRAFERAKELASASMNRREEG